MKPTNTAVPKIRATFRLQWEEAQGCHVILYPEGMVKLNKSAGEIMRRIDGTKSIADIIKELETAFSENDLEKEVFNFLEVAYDNGWIENKT